MKSRILGKISLLLVVGCLGMAQSVSAEGIEPYIMLGLAGGGEDLVTTSGPDLQAGGGYYLGLGVAVESADSNLLYQASFGYKHDSIDFDNPSGDSSITTTPLDFSVLYKVDNLAFGGGLVYYLSPEWELCISSSCGTVKFDDALGVFVEMRHRLSKRGFWGARLTNVDYEYRGEAIDAGSLRLHLGWLFSS